jgi:solute carrier family 25 (mitochondrial adenine nucleotide translocator), member 4/5/6/31
LINPTVASLTAVTPSTSSGGFASSVSLAFAYSLNYARTRLSNDLKNPKNGGEARSSSAPHRCLQETIAADYIAGHYRGFIIFCIGIFINRGLYFGLFDFLKPLLPANLKDFLIANFFSAGVSPNLQVLPLPIGTIKRRVMTSGESKKYFGSSAPADGWRSTW